MVIGPPVFAVLKNMTHINCTMKSITPGLVNIDRRGRRLFFPWPLLAMDALAILNASRAVKMVFTTRDKEKDNMPMGVNQRGGALN